MKKITVLCPRTRKILSPEKTSFGRAFSVIFPILVYYIVPAMLVYGFAYLVHWMSNAGGTFSKAVLFFADHSIALSTIVKAGSLLIGCLILVPAFLNETPVFAVHGKRKTDLLLVALLGGIFALVVNSVFSMINITSSTLGIAQETTPLWAGLFVYGMVSPFTEEVVFRGIVYNRMRRQFLFPVAFMGSLVLFGIYHGNRVQAVYAIVLGIMITWMYERYGSFWYPVVFHAMANVFVYIGMKVPVLKDWILSVPGILINVVLVVLCLKIICSRK